MLKSAVFSMSLKRGGLISVFLFVVCFTFARNISPLEYGLSDATNGIERFNVLMRTHVIADSLGCGVSYDGIAKIEIYIPKSANGIPLTKYTDFGGVEIIVRNMQKHLSLFVLNNDLSQIDVSKEEIEKGDFRKIEQLRQGRKLLVIEDQTPWVKNRRGYNYGADRKDILLLQDGKAVNKTIATYNNDVSMPQVSFCDADNDPIIIKNLVFTRSTDSKYITYLFSIHNQNDVTISNVSVNTPEDSALYGDACFSISNCANITMADININGTYSQSNKFGYGFSMNNVWNSLFERIKAFGKWGVFGTNNMNFVTIVDSDINRFDIHCYGRDVYCENVSFKDLYNQFSSIYGKVDFNRCFFNNCIPVLYESSYNAYTPFDLNFKNCSFKLNKKNNYIITLFGVSRAYNDRPELCRKCLPNITIIDSTVELGDDVSNWYLIQTGGSQYKDTFDYISNIKLKKVIVHNSKNKTFYLYSEPIKTTKNVKKTIKIVSK